MTAHGPPDKESAIPKKHPVWLGIRILLVFAMYVVGGLLPAMSVIPASTVPPLADMQLSEGPISFRSVGGKSGELTVIKKNNGEKDVFSCRGDLLDSHSCIHSEYAGGFGQIHWFRVRMPIGESYKFPAQIVVNGEVVRGRSTVIEKLEEARIVVQFMYGSLALFVFVAVVFAMVMATERHESVED